MTWSLEGKRVSAIYLDRFHVNGRVELSRVCYGGGVRHTLVLDRAITVYGSLRDRVIVDAEQITAVDNR